MIHINRGMRDAYIANNIQNLYNRTYVRLSSSNKYWHTYIELFNGVVPTHQEWHDTSLPDKKSIAAGTHVDHTRLHYVVTRFLSPSFIPIAEQGTIKGFDLRMSQLNRSLPDAAGEATWFMLSNVLYPLDYVANADREKDYWQPIIGTVGAVGSGADMELTDVNLTIDKEVIFSDVGITLPLSYGT